MVVYQALFNYMTEESSYVTLSLHKTKQGARDAVAKELRKEHEEHAKLYNYNVEEMAYRYGAFEDWRVDKIEVME